MGIVYSVVMDAAAMTCLYFLFQIYEAKARYNGWRARHGDGTARGGNQALHAAGSAAPVPAADPGNQTPAGKTGSPVGVPGEQDRTAAAAHLTGSAVQAPKPAPA